MVARVIARGTGKTLSELLAAVHADPFDLAARAVYADALQDAGDPRGEFIALQLAGKATQREKTLLKDHRKRWLGPLAKLVSNSSTRFENGFLRTVAITSQQPLAPNQLAHPELATIEVLDVTGMRDTSHVATQATELLTRYAKLQELVIVARGLAHVAERIREHALTRLAVQLPSADLLPAALQRRTFPQLRALRVWNQDPGPDALVRSASAVPLDTFECELDGGAVRDAIAIGKLANIVATLTVTCTWGKVRVTRKGDKLAIRPDMQPDARPPQLAALITALGRDRVTIVKR